MLLKITFEITLLLITKVLEQTAAFSYFKYGLHISCMISKKPSKKSYMPQLICCQFSLIFVLIFSNNSFSLLQSQSKMGNVLKVVFFLNTNVLSMHLKQTLNYFPVSESFVCIVPVIAIYTTKVSFLGLCSLQSSLRSLLIFIMPFA